MEATFTPEQESAECTNLNREVLAKVVREVTDLRDTLNDILNGDPDNEYDLDPGAEYDFVTRVLSNFIGKCEGSYYHSGNDGFFARLAVEDDDIA